MSLLPRTLAALLLCGAAASHAGEWVRIGPEGGGIVTFAASASHPGVVYVATTNLVFRSADHGKSWHYANPPLTAAYDLAVDPRSPATAYAAGATGLYKTLDSGARWTKVFPFDLAEAQLVRLVAVDPGTPGRIWAAPFGGPLWRSLDGGRRWHTRADWPVDLATLTVDPARPSTLYATLEAGGVLKSTDSGRTWARIEQGLPAEAWVNALVIHPRDRRTLLLHAYAPSGGLFKSTDGGASWHRVPGWSGAAARGLAFDPGRPSDVYAATSQGVLKSIDGGATWAPSGLATDTIALLATPQVLLAGTGRGVVASSDRATSWRSSETGLTAQSVFGLAVDQQAPPRLYAGTLDGLFKSADGGAAWLRLEGLPAPPGSFYRGPLAVSPTDPQTVYATFTRHLATSTNGGRRWALTELQCTVPWSVTLDPASPGALYIVGEPGFGTSCSQVSPCTVYRIDATGTRCVLREPFNFLGPVPLFPVFEVDPHAPSRLLAVLVDGLRESSDAGVTWKRLSPRRPASLAFAADRPGLVYGGFAGAVGRSLDGGATWQLADLPVSGSVHSLALDPRDSSTLWAATFSDGVFHSTDSGRTWKATPRLPAGTLVQAIVVDPADPDLLYAATYFTSVLMLRQ